MVQSTHLHMCVSQVVSILSSVSTRGWALWSWSYGSWIYNYLCNQCLSPLTLQVWIWLGWGVLDTKLWDKVISDLQQVSGILRVLRFPPPIKLIAMITEILLKVALITLTLTLFLWFSITFWNCFKNMVFFVFHFMTIILLMYEDGVYVRHNSVLWNCVRLCYICNEKPYTDQTKSSLCFIPSSDFIIGDNFKGRHYLMLHILWSTYMVGFFKVIYIS